MTKDELVKLKRFAKQMQIELEKNADKGSIFKWRGVEDKLGDLEYHKAKLLIAIKEKNAYACKEYIADCSNILLSIGDELGLYKTVSKNDKHEAKMILPSIDVVLLHSRKKTKRIP